MLFNEDFLSTLSESPVGGVIEICRRVASQLDGEWDQEQYEILLEAYALFASLIDAGLLDLDIELPEISGNLVEDCSAIWLVASHIRERYAAEASKLKLQSYKAHFRTSLGRGFCYEFSQGDLERVQTLVNTLRGLIAESKKFARSSAPPSCATGKTSGRIT